ncbi:unnamed protein product [Lactuca virosa]|uniref:Uncharacterized protein n=1 Tax=Lactuca virosa TaxID=75947 RepID=A0AAU9PB18_9ASTR|nr:unnamed protein product [Lactuca virosa]
MTSSRFVFSSGAAGGDDAGVKDLICRYGNPFPEQSLVRDLATNSILSDDFCLLLRSLKGRYCKFVMH